MPKPKLPPRPDLVAIRDQWAAEKAAYIEHLVGQAPPLSPAQVARLTTLLRPNGEAAQT